MQPTPRFDSWWNSYRSGAISADDFKEAVRGLERELDAEKADHADTQRQWNEALDTGLKVVRERDALREQSEIDSLVIGKLQAELRSFNLPRQ